MTITTPVIVSWLFAAWWLVIGLRDYNLVRYTATGSYGRYREMHPLLLCLTASVDLILLGVFIALQQTALICVTLTIFTALWINWTVVAKRGWNKQG